MTAAICRAVALVVDHSKRSHAAVFSAACQAAEPWAGACQGTDHPGGECCHLNENTALCMEELVEYWQNKYSWEERQAALNKRFQQFRMPVNGINVHFAHHRSEDPHAVPLLLIHGWPGSFVEFVDILPLLNNPGEHCILAVVMLCAEGTNTCNPGKMLHSRPPASPVSLVVLLHFVSTA